VEYTVKKLAQLANVSSRTLRYYDEMDLLKPCHINASGYRIYGEKEVDALQQILFYRSMGLKLNDIKDILDHPDFNISTALAEHHQRLLLRRNQINQLISTVEKSIAHNKGEKKMSNKEKFEGFKKEKLVQNEAEFGKEIRGQYGDETVEASNMKFGNMSEEDYKKMKEGVMDEVKKIFKPEFINRIDEIIVFHSLTKEDIKKIVVIMITSIGKRSKAQMNIALETSEAVVDHLADVGFDPKYGARPLRRAIQTNIEDKLAEAILAGSIKEGDTVRVEFLDNEMVLQAKL